MSNVTIEHEIGEILRNGKDDNPPLPQQVSRFLGVFKSVQETTAMRAVRLAEHLEAHASELRKQATILVEQGRQIPDDVKNATEYEVAVRKRIEYWQPVVPDNA